MNNKRQKSIKTTIYLRILAGLYLLYTDYSLLSDWDSVKANNNQIFMAAAVTVFAIAALILVAFSLRKLIILNKKQKQSVEEDEKI